MTLEAEKAILGSMQRHDLLIRDILLFAEREHGEREIVTLTHEGEIRSTYSDVARRARLMSSAFERLGIRQGERIGTLMTNSQWHFELYYGVACMGCVCHTINPRLFVEQLAYIINHAGDRILCVDAAYLELIEPISAEIAQSVTTIVVVGQPSDDGIATRLEARFTVIDYEDLLATGSVDYSWPALDEDMPSSLCYTSGTTGNPKGVLYSHRSTVIHAYGANLKDAFGLGSRDVVLPLVPMFHANCWAFPYLAPMVGAKLILSQKSLMDGETITRLINREKVTFSVAVPTIWAALLRYLRASGETIASVQRLQVGGAACPFPIVQAFDKDYGIAVTHGWGMTELSPIGVINQPKPAMYDWPADERLAHQRKQGRGICGIDMKIVDAAGKDIPRDGKTSGRLMTRGHWVVDTYFGHDRSSLENGWFDTGDISTIDSDGYMQIIDRAKDVVKSGGEWISSVELEQIAMSIPGIDEAAVIPARHPKWDERPLLIAVRSAGSSIACEDVLAGFDGKIAKWWTPDDVIFVEELPHTATGKVLKTALREIYQDHFTNNVMQSSN